MAHAHLAGEPAPSRPRRLGARRALRARAPPADPHLGRDGRRPTGGSRATSCSRTPTGSRPARSRSTRPRRRSGRGSRRWGRRRAAARTRTTGSRTCSASTCTAPTACSTEFQHPQVGDTIGYGANVMRLERVEPGRVLAWRSHDGNWVWSFVLDERDGTTRLVSRNRFRLPTLAARLGMLPMEPGVARDGAEDAARDQGARRAAGRVRLTSPRTSQARAVSRNGPAGEPTAEAGGPQRLAALVVERGAVRAGRRDPLRERRPVVLEVGVRRLDDELARRDRREAGPLPQRRELARAREPHRLASSGASGSSSRAASQNARSIVIPPA